MTLQKKFFTSKQATATAFTIGLILAVGGSVFATSIGTDLSVSGTATITGNSTHTGTTLLTGLATMTNGYVSQASSTVVGALTTTGLSTLGNTVSGTGGFISAASSTVVGNFSIASTTSGNTLSVGTSTPAASAELAINGDLMLASTGTTTATIASGSSNTGGCINLRATDGTMIRIYATSSPTAAQAYTNAGSGKGFEKLVVEAGSCNP